MWLFNYNGKTYRSQFETSFETELDQTPVEYIKAKIASGSDMRAIQYLFDITAAAIGKKYNTTPEYFESYQNNYQFPMKLSNPSTRCKSQILQTELEQSEVSCSVIDSLSSDQVLPEERIREHLEAAIRQTIDDGFTTFITGMARGISMVAGEIILDLRKDIPSIRLVAAVPYRGYDVYWVKDWKEKYQSILSRADDVRYICISSSQVAFKIRYEWMLEHSKRLILVSNTIQNNVLNYAKAKGVDVLFA